MSARENSEMILLFFYFFVVSFPLYSRERQVVSCSGVVEQGVGELDWKDVRDFLKERDQISFFVFFMEGIQCK